MVVTYVVTLVIAQLVIDQWKAAELKSHAGRILERADAVADQTTHVLEQARQLETSPCSAEDLEQLRILSFQERFVRDVARLRGGSIVCSAAWGVLMPPHALPEPFHSIGPFRFWRDINAAPIEQVQSDMTASGSVAVVAAPGNFEDVGFYDPDIQTLVTSRDGSYVFRREGQTEVLLHAFHAGLLEQLHAYTVVTCHARRAICVVEAMPRWMLWSAPAWQLALLTFLGLLAGAGIGFMACAYLERRTSMATQLKQAIQKNQLRVEYQPIRALADRRLVGVEALARWSDVEGRSIPPDVFIPLAEKLGLIEALTHAVLRTVLSELGDRLRGPTPFYVSVNVRSEELVSEPFRRALRDICLAHDIPAHRIALEVTERSTSDYVDMSMAFKSVRDAGHQVMIDDFGTGYSNFAHLATLPLDAIKMDRAFTNLIGTQSLASEVIPGIMSVASALNVTLIVEGIETQEQLDYIQQRSPSARGQGWLLGRPSKAADLPLQ